KRHHFWRTCKRKKSFSARRTARAGLKSMGCRIFRLFAGATICTRNISEACTVPYRTSGESATRDHSASSPRVQIPLIKGIATAADKIGREKGQVNPRWVATCSDKKDTRL